VLRFSRRFGRTGIHPEKSPEGTIPDCPRQECNRAQDQRHTGTEGREACECPYGNDENADHDANRPFDSSHIVCHDSTSLVDIRTAACERHARNDRREKVIKPLDEQAFRKNASFSDEGMKRERRQHVKTVWRKMLQMAGIEISRPGTPLNPCPKSLAIQARSSPRVPRASWPLLVMPAFSLLRAV
jgi:hypothetical protein